jgi:hypothetical protein
MSILPFGADRGGALDDQGSARGCAHAREGSRARREGQCNRNRVWSRWPNKSTRGEEAVDEVALFSYPRAQGTRSHRCRFL